MKYRVWDRQEQCYLCSEEILLHPKGYLCPGDYKFVPDVGGSGTVFVVAATHSHFISNRYLAELSTGIHDKSDVEIYEGDILEGMGHVEYFAQEARFAINIQGELHKVQFYELPFDELKIVGNINIDGPDYDIRNF